MIEHRHIRATIVVATGVLSGLVGCPWLFAQGSTGQPKEESQERSLPAQQESSQDEIQELFSKVELRLERVTELLFQASSSHTGPATQVGAAGIDELIQGAESQVSSARSDIAKLLEATQRQGDAVMLEIDRMIEIAGKPST